MTKTVALKLSVAKSYVSGDKKKDNPNVLQKAQEYVNGIKLINEAIVEDIAHKNKVILKKNKQLIQKLTKK